MNSGGRDSTELTLRQFGRVLLHINKRRGFLSNRKTDTKDDTKIFKGSEDKIGITETQEAIGEDGFKTLGEYLASEGMDFEALPAWARRHCEWNL